MRFFNNGGRIQPHCWKWSGPPHFVSYLHHLWSPQPRSFLLPYHSTNPTPSIHSHLPLFSPIFQALSFRDYADKENSTLNKPLLVTNPPIDVPPSLLDGYEILSPPKGDDRVVLYTTTLRGVRKTFESCNAVRAAIEGLGVLVCERDISMDKGFKDELTELMTGKGNLQLPRVFVKGRYIGGFEEVMKVLEEGNLGKLLQGLPRLKAGHVCQGCGGGRFLPFFRCNGSCKLVMAVNEEVEQEQCRKPVVVQCSDCNENGLVICPICS